MCGDAERPDADDAAFTICHTRCRVSRCAPPRQKQIGRILPCRQRRARLVQVCRQRILRGLAQGHDAFLVAFTANQHVSRVQFQILKFRVDHLRHPQRARVKHFQHRPIPHGHRDGKFRVGRRLGRLRGFSRSHRERAPSAAPSIVWVNRYSEWDRDRSSNPPAGAGTDAAMPKACARPSAHPQNSKTVAG